MGQSLPQPTESELEILHVLWDHGPSSVRFVNEVLQAQRPVGYTTTLKLMQIMHDKGLLERDEDKRTHIYTAAISEEKAQQKLLSRFLQKTFKGSASKLVLQALGQQQPSKAELDEIRALLDNLEEKDSNG